VGAGAGDVIEIRVQDLSGQQRRLWILNIVTEKTGRDPDKSVPGTVVIQDSYLPENEVKTYLSELEGLGLIKICIYQ
jgi:hypothetical protein